MKWENVKEFRDRFQKYVEEHISPEQTEAILNIDAQIDFRDITKHLHTDLKKFSPFGPSNPKAIFCKSKRSFDIAYTIEDNIFKKTQVQLQIEDIRPNEG